MTDLFSNRKPHLRREISIRGQQHACIVDNRKISKIRKHKVKQVATVSEIVMLR